MVTDPIPDKAGLLTVAEAAAILGVNVFTVRRWIKAGRLEAIRMGEKLLRIRPDAIAHFLDAGATSKNGPADSSRKAKDDEKPANNQLSLVDMPGGEDVQTDGAQCQAAGIDPEQTGGLLTADEAAALAGVLASSIGQARRRGYLAAVRIGNEWKYRRDDVATYLEKPRRGARKHRQGTE